MTEKTTTEQLAEIEGQAEDTPATEYTPPEGWRVLAVGELLQDGDVWVNHEGESRPTKRVGERVNDERYIRPIEPEPQPQPQQNGLVRDVTHLLQESGVLDSAKAEQQMEELRSEAAEVNKKRLQQVVDLRNELNHVERLWGESRRRVTQLEELVSSLRTINEAQEKTVRLAGQENTDLKHRLEVVSAEWAEQVETSRRLQIELDAAQQVPQTVSDRFEEGWDAGTARAVETIAEWLEPIKGTIDAADNMAETERAGNLAADIIRALPAIMRSLTGLTPED